MDPGTWVWQTIPDPRCVGLALGSAAMPDPRCLGLKAMHDLTNNRQIEQTIVHFSCQEREKKEKTQTIDH
jgi:hypothetical protein